MNRFHPRAVLFITLLVAATLALASCSSPEPAKPATTAGQTAAASPASAEEKLPAPYATGKIVRLDPRFDKLIAPDAKIEKLTEGHKWVEGPVWNKKEGYLLYSDIPNNAIYKWQEGKGDALFLQPAGYTGTAPFTGKEPGTNGLTYNKDGLLVSCEHGDRRIAQLAADGKTKTTLADKYNGKRFNSPNDLVFKTNGDLYFTDPPYGLPKGVDDPQREMDYCGVYRLGKDGKLTLLTKEITRPNGIALAPDEKKLYVASSDPDKAIWMVYDLKPDGTLGAGKVFKDVTAWVKEGRKGLPDGMKVDKDGNLWATGPGGVHVFAADGTHLGSIETGVPTANCAFGDDGTTLYITANTALIRVKTGTKGLGF
ncbi:MAG: SMP-30/gluconolactonase/LRE family protein [Acidobacteria bacterium]|nr:SMP-30/gluconolactonase/LRE family protein [Acidobacteriota bacterium]MBI3423368.1 SMP-30/gluconolactonase/LRE family protein [Acidobacteriota bacterium]